jgi:HD-GYP domain-containing protein (c-di-GMP phosphodiesterase class II)
VKLEENFLPAAKDLYKQALSFVVQKEMEVRRTGRLTLAGWFDLASQIVHALALSEHLNSYAVYYYDVVDITRSHMVNTAIFSTVLAGGLNYQEDDLMQICAAGLLHDIGISLIDQEILKKDVNRLSKRDLVAVQSHSRIGYNLILKADPRLEAIATSILQHHERGNGSGYPQKITENQMLPMAKILALVDTYTALIHPRDHRDALVPPVGLQELIKQEGKCFSRPLMKTLIETISLYPAGCYVKLNTGKVAKVIRNNPKYPNRPEVEILFDISGKRTKPRQVNLSQDNLIYIQKCTPPPGMTPMV